MKLSNIRPFTDNGSCNKNQLYKIISDKTIEFVEEHDDADDCLIINVKHDDKLDVLYAKEYKFSGISSEGAKDVDVNLILKYNDKNKLIYRAIDLKRSLLTDSKNNSDEDNLTKTYNVISHLVSQWEAVLIYAKMVGLVYNEFDLTYTPEVVTRYYNEENLKALLKSVESSIDNCEKKCQGIVLEKIKLKNQKQRKQIKLLSTFANGIVKLKEETFNITFHYLQYNQEENRHVFNIDIFE